MATEIGLFAVLLPLACAIIFVGYKIADRGFDTLDRGQKIRGSLLFWSGILLACGAAILLPAAGFWLALEEGRNWLWYGVAGLPMSGPCGAM